MAAFQKATKKQAKARIAISGPAGSGKTYTALRLATAMCQRVAVIDTEHGSASKYADEFDFDVLELDDFHPNNYITAIKAAEAGDYDGLIIDSISHEWSGKNGCLELLESVAKRSKGGNKFAAWSEITPLHSLFIETIHQAKLHIIATLRAKMDYIQTEDERGKTLIKKVGMAPITREGSEYEFDIFGELDLDHNLTITKSRCRAIADKVFPQPGKELADIIKAWLTDGAPMPGPQSTHQNDNVKQRQAQATKPQTEKAAHNQTSTSVKAPDTPQEAEQISNDFWTGFWFLTREIGLQAKQVHEFAGTSSLKGLPVEWLQGFRAIFASAKEFGLGLDDIKKVLGVEQIPSTWTTQKFQESLQALREYAEARKVAEQAAK